MVGGLIDGGDSLHQTAEQGVLGKQERLPVGMGGHQAKGHPAGLDAAGRDVGHDGDSAERDDVVLASGQIEDCGEGPEWGHAWGCEEGPASASCVG